MEHAFLMPKTLTYMQSAEVSQKFFCRLEGFGRYFQWFIHLTKKES